MNSLFIKSVFAFFCLPFIIAYVIPVLIGVLGNDLKGYLSLALPIILLGTAVLMHCIERFYSEGKGTLAPWSPPKHLVQSGLYAYSRNPMYLGTVIIILGWSIYFRSTPILAEAIIMFLVFHLRVKYYEEREMVKLFPDDWYIYTSKTMRWLGRK